MDNKFQPISFLEKNDTNIKSKINLSGYEVIQKYINPEEIKDIRKEIIYCEKLQNVNNTSPEYGQVRSPLISSKILLEYLTKKELNNIFNQLINEGSICHLYNGQICRKKYMHNQSLWHRDLNKHYISEPPLAYNALLFLGQTDNEIDIIPQKFDILNGSHLFKFLPSESDFKKTAIRLELNPGDLLVFNSLVWHRVVPCEYENQMFLNTMFTAAFIKQQLDLLGTTEEWIIENGGLDSKLAKICGYWSRAPKNLDQFRNPKDGIRTYRANQG